MRAESGTKAAATSASVWRWPPKKKTSRASVGIVEDEVVQRDPQLGGQVLDMEVAGVDQLAAELRHLAVGEEAAQAAHPPAHPLLRFEDARLHPRLPEAVAGGEARDAGADDDDPGIASQGESRPQRAYAAGKGQSRRGAAEEAAAGEMGRLTAFGGLGDLGEGPPCAFARCGRAGTSAGARGTEESEPRKNLQVELSRWPGTPGNSG